MDLRKEYREFVSTHLNGLNERFEKELSDVANQNFSDAVKFLKIEYDSSCFSDEFSVCFYSLDKNGNLVGDVHWFLKDMAVVVPADVYEDERYEDIEPWDTASDMLETWLMDRWRVAGNHIYPAYLAHHDSYFQCNIIDGSQTNWDKMIEAANS